MSIAYNSVHRVMGSHGLRYSHRLNYTTALILSSISCLHLGIKDEFSNWAHLVKRLVGEKISENLPVSTRGLLDDSGPVVLHVCLVTYKTLLNGDKSYMEHRYEIDFKGIILLERHVNLGLKFGNQAVKEQISFNMGMRSQEATVAYGAQLCRGSP